jgi:hypothetical protein
MRVGIDSSGVPNAATAVRHAELGLRCVRPLPLLSDAHDRAMLAANDLVLIIQEKGTGRCFPSKLLSVVCAGLLVLAVADDGSEFALAVRQGDSGFLVAPG